MQIIYKRHVSELVFLLLIIIGFNIKIILILRKFLIFGCKNDNRCYVICKRDKTFATALKSQNTRKYEYFASLKAK